MSCTLVNGLVLKFFMNTKSKHVPVSVVTSFTTCVESCRFMKVTSWQFPFRKVSLKYNTGKLWQFDIDFCKKFSTARRTPGIRNRISDQTFRNRLHQSGLRSRRPLKCMELKRRHRIARLQWARARLQHFSIRSSEKSTYRTKNTYIPKNDCDKLYYVGVFFDLIGKQARG